MSAFIVSEETIRRCAQAICMPHGHFGLRIDRHTAFENKDPETVGQSLWLLNVKAVDGRYRESNPVPLYRHVSKMPVAPIVAYKALSCLLYQCSEEPVIGSPLYKDLERVADMLAHHIARSLPEWDSAPGWE